MHQLRCSIIAVLAMLFVPMAWADPVTFVLTNGTDEVVMEFYAAPPGVSDWEEDILGDDVLEPGDSVEITIGDGREDCDYDFLVVYEDESEIEYDEVAICDGESYVIE